MSNADRHPLPSYAAVSREDLLAAWAAIRPLAIAVGIVLLFMTLLISDTTGQISPPILTQNIIAVLAMVLAVFLPLTLWAREIPSKRAYFLAMPVGRLHHHLSKNLAGWLWTMVGTALVYLWAMLAVRITNATIAPLEPWRWLAPLVAVTVVYLIVAAVATASDHASWCFFGGYLLFGFLQHTALVRILVQGRFGLETLIGGVPGRQAMPTLAEWLVASGLWMGAGVLALYAASRVHREA